MNAQPAKKTARAVRKTTAITQTRRFGRKPPPENETREDRFKRLAQARVVASLREIRLVGNLASGDYAWTQEQATHIITTLQTALDELANKFARQAPQRKLEELFNLDVAMRGA